MKIRPTSAKECLPLRQEVLRNGKDFSFCKFKGDTLNSTYHLGAFKQEKIIGIVSLFEANISHFTNHSQYQLRGMAISPGFQGQGIGRNLLTNAEDLLITNQIKLVWCNARTSALDFYKKQHYQSLGEKFQIEGVGPHIKLYKFL
ncbi:GNAT family N-acetyltransferase [Psychroflexus sp. ALD_RP9]|uniref:GNAT family N-acetyltransferase n=1 Tax=Psychroflexus sp. ALD_RP9 TaxID=2777186 RepID=UPI001A8E3547|nr:GNAT family N-acetyltransferase [Psychroflexus sp. ALD_RP9]QSS97563.1 GNAT family N-acetyltransferase [Psychroflexus sp. ALD_RP9]